MRAGAVVTVLGLVCTLIAIAPLAFDSLNLPSLWWWLSMLTGVGLAMVIAGLWQSSRARRRMAADPGRAYR